MGFNQRFNNWLIEMGNKGIYVGDRAQAEHAFRTGQLPEDPNRKQTPIANRPKKVKPPEAPASLSKKNVGVRKNTESKSKKGKMQIASTANIIPLAADAPGYSGLRIS